MSTKCPWLKCRVGHVPPHNVSESTYAQQRQCMVISESWTSQWMPLCVGLNGTVRAQCRLKSCVGGCLHLLMSRCHCSLLWCLAQWHCSPSICQTPEWNFHGKTPFFLLHGENDLECSKLASVKQTGCVCHCRTVQERFISLLGAGRLQLISTEMLKQRQPNMRFK